MSYVMQNLYFCTMPPDLTDLKAGAPSDLSFSDTEISFRHSSNFALKRAYWLFRIINVNFLVKLGPPVTNFAIKIGLPIKGLIKATIFKHFCGGETIRECEQTIKSLHAG